MKKCGFFQNHWVPVVNMQGNMHLFGNLIRTRIGLYEIYSKLKYRISIAR